MIQTTLGAIAHGFTTAEACRIYVIFGDENIPLYVGQAKDAIGRVRAHLRRKVITFDIELKTFKDWEKFSVHLYECDDLSVGQMEDDLIYALAPVYNSHGQKNSRENSDRWYQLHPPREIANEGTASAKQ
jgi:hypothetical protein